MTYKQPLTGFLKAKPKNEFLSFISRIKPIYIYIIINMFGFIPAI